MFFDSQREFLMDLLKDGEVTDYLIDYVIGGYELTDEVFRLVKSIINSKNREARGFYFQKLADEFYKQKGDKDAC